MAEEVAKLKATIEIDSKNAEQEVKKIDKQFRDLEKNIKKLDETLKFTQELLKNISFSKGGNDFKVLNESLNTFKNTISKLGSDLKIFKTELSEISKMALRVKQDTAKVDLKEMQQAINKANSTIKELKNTISINKNEMEKLKNQSLKNAISTESYMQSLEKTKQAINKTRIEEEKLNATRQKTTLKQLSEEEKRLSSIRQTNANINNKSIINEQKLATEREKTRKATTQAEQAELRLAKQKDSLSNKTNTLSKNTGSLSGALSTAYIKIQAVFYAVKLLSESYKGFIGNQSKIVELQNVLDQTFGDSGKSISQWAENTGTKLGRSTLTMTESIAEAGALLKSMNLTGKPLEEMSKKLSEMSVNMASFWNTSDTEAWQSLRSAITGETESIKRFGMVMTDANLQVWASSQGLKMLNGQLTLNGKGTKVNIGQLDDYNKSLIRYGFLVDKASLFENDAMRTKESTANQNKILKESLTELSTTIGKNLDPAYNKFIHNLNEGLGIIIETEKQTHGLSNLFLGLGKILGIIITPITKVVELLQKLGDIPNKLSENKVEQDLFQDIIQNQKDFLVKNEKFFKDRKKQYDEAEAELAKSGQQSNLAYEETEKYKLDVLKRYGEQQKVQNEYNRAKTLETYDLMRQQSFGIFTDMINASGKMKEETGKNLIDTLDFYVKFTRGMSEEVKKQVSVISALGSARSAVEQGKSLKEAGNIASQTYNLTMKTLGMDTGNQDKLIAEMRKLTGYKEVKTSDFNVTEVLGDMIGGSPYNNGSTSSSIGNGTTDTSTPITLQSMKDEYDLEISNAETYAKERGLAEEELQKNLLSINDSYGRKALEESQNSLQTNKKGFKELSSTLFNNANAIQDSIDTTDMQNKAIEDNSKNYEEMSKDSEDYFNNMIDNFDKIKYNTTEYEDEFTVAFRGKNSVESMNSAYDTLFEKYKGNTEALELLTDIYNNQTGSIETFSDKLSASAGFVSELSNVLDNEFLSGLANAMNGISSMSSVISNAGGIANLGFGGWASIATSAISIASSIGLFGGDDAEEQQRQAEINQNFQDAVNTFAQAVEDFSSKEKIDLANVLEGFSGINVSEVGILTSASYNASSLHNYFAAHSISKELEKYISENFGLDLDVYPILRKYKYNVADTIEYINSLIKDSYTINLDAYKEQVGITSDSFVSAISDALENAEDLDITSMITSAFNESYSAMIGEVFGESIGDTISETIFDVLANSGVTESDLANMSVSEQIAYIQSLMNNSSTYLAQVFEELGLSVAKTTSSFDALNDSNMPSVIKLALLENQAITGYNSTGSSSGKSGTTIHVATVYGSVDSTFVNMVNKAVGYNNVKRTGN